MGTRIFLEAAKEFEVMVIRLDDPVGRLHLPVIVFVPVAVEVGMC